MTGPRQSNGPHRIARVNYLPRSLGFGGVFIAIILLAVERQLGTPALLLAVLCFILYPHLAYLHARIAPDSKKAEQINLLFDSGLLGVWAAALGFNIWITFVLLLATLLNNAVNGGLPRLALAAACFAGGSLLWVAFAGLDFRPESGLVLTLWVAVAALLYALGVGITHHRQNQQLAKAHKDLARNTQVFRSLLEMGALTNDARDVPELVDTSLNHFQQVKEDLPFGILLFDRSRFRLLIHGAFRGVSGLRQDRILRELAEHNGSEQQRETLVLNTGDRALLAIPMHHHLEQASGYLLMDREWAQELGNVLKLFVDQLASALQNKLLNEELRKAAETDALTGLFNRGYLEEKLAEAVAGKQAHMSADFSIIMLDVIGLKAINDTFGHQAGDELIFTVGERLLHQARKTDVAARFGGDEFVMLCRGCNEDNALNAMERLMDSFRQNGAPISLPDGKEMKVPLEISVGVAGSDRHPPERVLAKADERMYEHKNAFYEERGRKQR